MIVGRTEGARLGSSRYAFAVAILMVSLVLASTARAETTVSRQSNAPWLVIHLDAISTETFLELYSGGHLPNIQAVFSGGKLIQHVLANYPGGTEIIYPRLKNLAGPADPYPVGWERYDRDAGRIVRQPLVFLELISSIPAYARSQMIQGLPGLDVLAGLALLNVPRLLKDRNIVEFFWFATDSLGHVFGEEAQKTSVKRLDWFIGRLSRLVDLDSINLVIYGDHGMSYLDYQVDTKGRSVDIVGDDLLFYFYPGIWLKDPANARRHSMALAYTDEVDFAFYRESESSIVGFHQDGMVILTEHDGKIIYSFDGYEPFGYVDLGCIGKPLDAHEWLAITAGCRYPAVPPSIYNYMSNPWSADMVLVLNPPKAVLNKVLPAGAHQGFAATDLMVPVLLKGPDIHLSTVPDHFWLHELHGGVLGIDLREVELRPREMNVVSLCIRRGSDCLVYSGIDLSVSPMRDVRVNLGLTGDGLEVGGEYAIYSSFLVRTWVGGALVPAEGGPVPVLTASAEFFLNRLSFGVKSKLSFAGSSREYHTALQVTGGLRLSLKSGRGLSLGITW